MKQAQIRETIDNLKVDLDLDRLETVCENIDSLEDGSQYIEALLELLEAHPDEDFGSPGDIVRTLEKYRRKGYEEKLVVSLKRNPILHTTWMLNRLLNGSDGQEYADYKSLLQNIAENKDIDEDIADLAREFLEE